MTFDDAAAELAQYGQTLRIYDLRHDLGKAAMAIACADEVTDAPALAREAAQ